MDVRELLNQEESSQGQAPSGEIQEIPQSQEIGVQEVSQPIPTPTESERYFQSELDKAKARLSQYERWDPWLQQLEKDPGLLEHNLKYIRGDQTEIAAVVDSEPELDEIPTAEQVKAYNAWGIRQQAKQLQGVATKLEQMEQQARVNQAMQQSATVYMQINPTATVQEAYEYAQWSLEPQNVTPENLSALFRAMRAGVSPAQAEVVRRIQENSQRRIPGVTITGEQVATPALTPDQQIKKAMLAMGNRGLF
jgi:hypothetical protein